MRSESFPRQIESSWSSMALRWWNVPGCESRKCLGRGSAANAKDYVCAKLWFQLEIADCFV